MSVPLRIAVISHISIPEAKRTIPNWEHLRGKGHTVDIITPSSRDSISPPDAVVSMGVGVMGKTLDIIKQYPQIPLFCYNWDTYEWVWSTPRQGEYDYKKYGELLKQATEVWVPSICTGERTTQWWGIKNWKTILTSVPYWDAEDVTDHGYVYCPLREIPDRQWPWFEQACKELNIPYKMTQHKVSYDEYRHTLAHCSFTVSHCYELSTGGLSIMEGYYLGKPCLLADSIWHGGRDYMQNRAHYFGPEFKDLKRAIRSLWDWKLTVEWDHKQWIRDNFSDHIMTNKILERIQWHIKK